MSSSFTITTILCAYVRIFFHRALTLSSQTHRTCQRSASARWRSQLNSSPRAKSCFVQVSGSVLTWLWSFTCGVLNITLVHRVFIKLSLIKFVKLAHLLEMCILILALFLQELLWKSMQGNLWIWRCAVFYRNTVTIWPTSSAATTTMNQAFSEKKTWYDAYIYPFHSNIRRCLFKTILSAFRFYFGGTSHIWDHSLWLYCWLTSVHQSYRH